MAENSSAENTVSPSQRQVKRRMMSRGTTLPSAPGRKPVSIGWAIITRTSMTSPGRALAGTWISVRAISGGLLDAGGEHDDHVHRVGPDAAIVHARQRHQLLAGCEADARGQFRLAGARADRGAD